MAGTMMFDLEDMFQRRYQKLLQQLEEKNRKLTFQNDDLRKQLCTEENKAFQLLQHSGFDTLEELAAAAKQNASGRASSITSDLEAAQSLVHDLHQDLQREHKANQMLQISCNDALFEVTGMNESNAALKEDNERLRRERDDARKIAEDQEMRIAAMRRATEQLREASVSTEPPKEEGMASTLVSASFPKRTTDCCKDSAKTSTMLSVSWTDYETLSLQLAALTEKYEALIQIKEKAARRYREDYKKWKNFKSWLFKQSGLMDKIKERIYAAAAKASKAEGDVSRIADQLLGAFSNTIPYSTPSTSPPPIRVKDDLNDHLDDPYDIQDSSNLADSGNLDLISASVLQLVSPNAITKATPAREHKPPILRSGPSAARSRHIVVGSDASPPATSLMSQVSPRKMSALDSNLPPDDSSPSSLFAPSTPRRTTSKRKRSWDGEDSVTIADTYKKAEPCQIVHKLASPTAQHVYVSSTPIKKRRTGRIPLSPKTPERGRAASLKPVDRSPPSRKSFNKQQARPFPATEQISEPSTEASMIHHHAVVSEEHDSVCKRHSRYRGHLAGANETINAQYEINTENNAGLPYQFHTVVRNKDERRRLEAGDCECCREYYNAVDPVPPGLQKPLWKSPSPNSKPLCTHLRSNSRENFAERISSFKYDSPTRRDRVNDHQRNVSKHRHLWAPPATPPDYWTIAFPDTQQVEDINRRANDIHLKKRRQIENEASKPGGRYKKRT